MASTPTSTPAVYWAWRSPLAEMMALTGPVRQVEHGADEGRHDRGDAAADGDGCRRAGAWPAAVSTAMPWPFCTTSTVIASGTTSSAMAAQENCGSVQPRGGQHADAGSRLGRRSCRRAQIASAPAPSATISGGRRAASGGMALTARNAAVMAAAIHRSAWKARTQSRPNCRNTPATMPMTIGIGTACHGAPHPAGERRAPASAGRWRCRRRPPRRSVRWPSAGPDQHGAGDGPEERQRLAIGAGCSRC